MQAENIAIIGSTGSVGTQTLDVIRAYPSRYKVFALAAYQDADKLFEQIKNFKPKVIALYLPQAEKELKNQLKKLPLKDRPLIWSGKTSWEKVTTHPLVEKIVFASSGTTALPSLLKAISNQKRIALANKEMIVVEGEKIMRLARKNKVTIVPIDSEHSAIFQALQGENIKHVEKIILTCSGGPFYGKTKKELQIVTVKEALRHPTWKMGSKIAIDCATLMNKGFEIIEAKYLFNLHIDQIEIMIHPQSIIHSLIVFKDGNIKAQLSVPDMHIPISYALAYPERISTHFSRLDFSQLQKLILIPPDLSNLPGPTIAREALKKGRKALQDLVQANENAVKKFLDGKIKFLEIYEKIKPKKRYG